MFKGYFIICHNNNCRKKFLVSSSNSSNRNRKYCSRKCSNHVNNSLKIVLRKCPTCGNTFSGDRKYCALKCIRVVGKPKYSSQDLLSEIKKFYATNSRIPTKREFSSRWRPILRVFGSWNNAVTQAGLIPNNVIFSRKYQAKDGHLCDSFSEKIIDDWLFDRNIPHQVHIYYPNQKRFKCDFLIKNLYWVEFLGLSGHKKYDEVLRRKRILIQNLKINFIEIQASDLYPLDNLINKIGYL